MKDIFSSNDDHSKANRNKSNFLNWFVLAILSLVDVITTFGETMLIPAIPDLIFEFDLSYSQSSWILTSYLIMGAVSTPVVAKLSDIFGSKKLLVVVLSIYSFGLLLGGISNSFIVLIVSRVIQGIGISIFPIAFNIIKDYFPHEKLAFAQGVIAAMFSGGAVLGLVSGGFIVETYGWKMTFISILPLSLLTILLIIKFITKPHSIYIQNYVKKIDIKGLIFLIITITFFLLFLTYLELIKTNLSLSIALIFISILGLILFVKNEKHMDYPLIDLKILKDRILFPINIVLLFAGTIIFMIYQTIAIYIKSPEPFGLGGTSVDVINVQLPFMIVLLVMSIISGFVISKMGNRKPTIIGGFVTIAGFILLLFYHSDYLQILLNLVIIATGISFVEIGGFNIATVFSPRKYLGISIGVTTLLFLIGMSLGPAISGMYMQLFQAKLVVDSNFKSDFFPTSISYNLIFSTAVVLSIVMLFMIFFTKSQISRLDRNNVNSFN